MDTSNVVCVGDAGCSMIELEQRLSRIPVTVSGNRLLAFPVGADTIVIQPDTGSITGVEVTGQGVIKLVGPAREEEAVQPSTQFPPQKGPLLLKHGDYTVSILYS